MKRLLLAATALGVIATAPTVVQASPEQDLKAFRAFFKERYPNVPFNDYKNGIYALDAERRAAWEDFEDFSAPYEDGVALGKKLFETPFANGKTYASCFPNGGMGVRQDFPKFDKASGDIITLEGTINECRTKNGEKPLKWGGGDLAAISAYMGYTSRGKKLNVQIPDDPRALAWYERGKDHFYAKRGQLNFSCADCHVYQSGTMARANLLSPALGHVTHFPVWRKKWAGNKDGATVGFGTLQKRYGGCNKQVRAKPFKPQSDEYKALEYFHTYMSNGLEVNAPALRQ